MTDEVTMREVQQGSMEAYEQLVRTWEGPMLNYFYRCLGDMDAAEDLRQDLFVRVYQRREGWRGNGTFRAWLYAIAANLVRTHLRKAGRTVSIEEDKIEAVMNKSGNPGGPETADETVQRKQSARFVREMLAVLAPDDREALVLRFFERLRYREISEALGIHESSAKSRVYRAIERMRDMVVQRGLTATDFL